MSRLLPKSLLGQVMLVLALGLMVGQAVSGVMLYRSAEERREIGLVSTLAFRIAVAADRQARPEARALREQIRAERHRSHFGDHDNAGGHRPLHLRAERSKSSPIRAGEARLVNYEATLRDVLERQDVAPEEIVVTRRLAGEDPFIASRPRIHERIAGPGWEKRPVLVAGAKLAEGQWLVVRIAEPRPPRGVIGSILLQTLVIFAVLVALLFPLMRRITRPLARLTERVDDFARNPDRPVEMEESGPQDIRHLIGAHNAMEARIAAMLDEKDVMLGAIGHDLKTPLAALRVRIENVADDAQRNRMAESIEDIANTLDDILNLARVGRSSDPLEPTDLAALTASLVEEYEDMGEPVELREASRVVAPIRATWLRRALRNLIGNAIRYGGGAKVDVLRDGDQAVIRVDDDGPGIADDQIGAMLEPFARGEASRNRSTGGAGLGLTLARAIAEQHGGAISLANRAGGGLRAEICLPH